MIPKLGDKLLWDGTEKWELVTPLRKLSKKEQMNRINVACGFMYKARGRHYDWPEEFTDMIFFEAKDIKKDNSLWTFIESPFQQLVREILDKE